MSKASELANLIGNINAGGGGVNRNVIINGAMNVAQRSTSEADIGATSGYYVCDRWKINTSTGGRFTVSQDSSAPSGFANSLKFDCTTADTSIASDEQIILQQRIEGQNLQAFAKGTSDAKPFAVSFYVKGNDSATYICEIRDRDNSRDAGKTFNVTTDWTRVELTFDADTTGALDDDNARSFDFNIILHAGGDFITGTLSNTFAANATGNRVGNTGDGSTSNISSFVDSIDRTFFITGVQLEVGQNPTSFEVEPFERTLAKCQRYFEIRERDSANTSFGNGFATTTTSGRILLPYLVQKRSDEPTLTATGTANLRFSTTGTSRNISSGSIAMDGGGNKNNAVMNLSGLSGSVTDGTGATIILVTGDSSLQFNDEL